jgi:hypothetical protein
MARANGDSDAEKDDLADALSRIEHDVPSETEPSAPIPPPPARPTPPASAAEFRRPSRPSAPGPTATPPAAPAPTPKPPTPPPAPVAKPRAARPDRPDRPDRPTGPPTTQWSEDEAAEVAANYNAYDPMSEIVDDDDAVIVPAPEPEVFAPHAPAKKPTMGPMGVPNSLGFRRTVIPILLTCGVLLIGIGLLKWIGGSESLFRDMSMTISATLCGAGAFLLLVAALNMMQVRSELAAATRNDKVQG